MKKLALIAAMVMILGMSMPAQAALIDRGADTLGNHLIYDTGRDITWYDYTNNYNTWNNQMSWAESLTLTMADGRVFSGWRLPLGYEPLSSNESEMGHLYYDELGNSGEQLTNIGPFTHLQPYDYWLGTEMAGYPNYASFFYFDLGREFVLNKADGLYAIAVHPGDVAAVPLPGTVLLLGPALIGMGLLRRKLRRG